MTHAFPHDELKPITKSYTDSLGKASLIECSTYVCMHGVGVFGRLLSFAGELGNVDGVPVNGDYSGVALTMTDALSTLAVIGDAHNFERSVNWLIDNVRPGPGLRVVLLWGRRKQIIPTQQGNSLKHLT